MFKRSDKVAEAIHKIVSELMIRGLKDPRIGFVTITGVKVTQDSRQATIYYSVVGSEQEKKDCAAGLSSARGFIRKEVGAALQIRFTPEIIFKYDTSVDYGHRIDSLLKEIGTTDDGDTQ
ncbi:ribosome-binding factor A [Geomesophilobacter sediminis]|uniref:Ribosome-binding factor A n=1 Tax=Geomesophilobacter sediminis TaxID=2798584 RepID=A0A8J7M174_9BACT|nr:ribosome-binding factor A [Geomesophilobacter sediminis]MBJ6726747.1 ribosome-binding factor A [Geomesophilobacter sediminis]